MSDTVVRVREAKEEDLPRLLRLYTHLHAEPAPEITPAVREIWRQMMDDPNHYIVLVEDGGVLAASCVLLVVPNLTHGQRPYGLVENVVTHSAHRRRGHARRALQFAREIAIMNHCYKLMLMTSGREEGSCVFYEKAGYNRQDKTAFVQWL